MLRGIGQQVDDRLVVGPQSFDDAGVVLLGDGDGLPTGSRVGLVQTVDFFPPVVDDPWFYGAIAAANALSDVYAMGGRPLSALGIASFPKGFPDEWVARIFEGAGAKLREAGCVLAGGHTVEDGVQFGFAVTGLIDPGAVVTNAGARPGDVAYLTKAVGMGGLTTAAKRGELTWDELRPAAEQMATLNREAAEAMTAAGARACTDVTGYGLVGHARNVGAASEVTVRLGLADVPLADRAAETARRGVFSGGARRGREGLAAEVSIAPGLEDALVDLVFDAETSGGLLVFVPPERAADLERELGARGVPAHRVGRCVAHAGVAVELVERVDGP